MNTISETPAAPPPRRLDRLATALTALLLAASLAGAFAMAWFGSPAPLHGNDFKHLYLGARLLEGGRNPYDAALLLRAARDAGLESINPYVYLPTTGLLMRPLLELDYPQALLAWFWLNWALAWAVVLGGPSLLRVPRPAAARLAGAAFLAGAMPFLRQQTAGQMNVVTAALVLLAAAGLARRRAWWTGAALALGFGWKIAPALLIAALAPLRRWRALAWSAAGVAALLGISLLVYGMDIHKAALGVIGQMGYGHSTFTQFNEDFYRQPFNQSPNSLFHHLVTANPHTTPWIAGSPRLANGLTVAFSAALGLLWLIQVLRASLSERKRNINDYNDEHKHEISPHSALRAPRLTIPLFLAASLAMLLLPSLMWDHYAVQALPALLWVFGQPRTLRSWPRALLAFAILAALTWPINHQAPPFTHSAGLLMMSLRLWPVLALYVWLLFVDEN